MKPLDKETTVAFIENEVVLFHQKRLKRLDDLSLEELLAKKNPYLFKAKNILTAQELVEAILSAYVSSGEESAFGNFLERLAILVCAQVHGGRKSSAKGIDLEFEADGIWHVVAIKSGPNWGNSSQINDMLNAFRSAGRALRTSDSKVNPRYINGCCYGRDDNPDKGEYYKLCSQTFWELLTGETDFYLEILEPLGHRAKERTEEFQINYASLINRFTGQLIAEFCDANGAINWEKLVKYNSGSERPPRKPRKRK